MLYKFYIGANNKTKKLENKKAIKLIASQFQGFTAYKGLGYWQGNPEKNLIVEIETTNKKKIIKTVDLLKKKLKQQAIGLAKIGKIEFI